MLNAYVVKGSEKNVMIDLVKDWDGAVETVDAELKELGLPNGQLDYLVLNHMEPDHTGAMVSFVEKHPNVEILCSAKAVPLSSTSTKLKRMYGRLKMGRN